MIFLPSFNGLVSVYNIAMSELIDKSKQELRRVFKTEHSRFIVLTGLKVSGISLLVNFIVYSFLFQVMKLNYAFFKSNGLSDTLDEDVFFGYIMAEASDNLEMFLLFHIYLFFIGTYVGWLILRPFRTIAEYSEAVIINPSVDYKVEKFSTYKLLNNFSDYFFHYLKDANAKGELRPNTIPPQYSKIHQPIFDGIFMMHFGLLLLIISISSSVFIVENTSTIFDHMIELANKTLYNARISNKFFGHQSFVVDDTVTLAISLTAISYLALGFHLYEKVSGAAFGIFSTMRAFMKGNHFSRVHLVGYAYVRDYTRKFNKYLDHIEKIFDKDKPHG